MGASDSEGRNSSGELDKILGGGFPKKARIPLPQPSLSLSTTSLIQTEYCNQESDLRDEINHDADIMSMDTVREGAENVSQLTSLIGHEQLSNSEGAAIDETDKMNSEIVNSLSMESLKSVSSSMLYTALEGNVLWSIMNHETAVLPDLTPRAASAVAELEEEEDSIFVQLDMKSTDTCLKTSSSLATAKARNTKSSKQNGIISDNSVSIEMSYSGFMDASKKEKVIRDSRSSSTNDPTPAPARKQVNWSSKILGRTGGQMKKVKTNPILKRFKKKRNCKMEDQDNVGGKFECAINDDSNEKLSVKELNKAIKKANNEEEDAEETKETEMGLEATAEPSAPPIDDPVVNPVVSDNPLACAKPTVPEPRCSFQEVKEAIFALVGCNRSIDFR